MKRYIILVLMIGAFSLSLNGANSTIASLTSKAKNEFLLGQYNSSINSYKEALAMAGRLKDTNSTIEILNSLTAVILSSANGEEGAYSNNIQTQNNINSQETYAIPDSILAYGALALNIPPDKLRELCNNYVEVATYNKKMIKRERILIAIFSGLFLIVLAVAIYYIRQFNSARDNYIEVSEKSKEKIESLNLLLDKRVSSFRKFLDAASSKRERPAEFLSAFKKYIKIENGKLPDAFGDIIDIANLYNNDVVNRLRLSYPSLNDEELYMCALISLDFPISSIKFIYNHASEDSMYNKRARLKKKLGLEGEERPEKFIKEMILCAGVAC